MLGFHSARAVVEHGRAAFFSTGSADLPLGRSAQLQAHDLVPQFGFVGDRYKEKRVLILGINPGNGPRDDVPTPADARMLPALEAFANAPTPERFARASSAYMAECQRWPVWTRHCKEVLGSGGLSFDQIAYSNCLPWRTDSESRFANEIALRATELYVEPLIAELKPKIVIALGKRAATMLTKHNHPSYESVVWNRAQAATPNVIAERAAAAARIFAVLSSGAH